MANIFDLTSMDGNITPEKARLQIDLQIATNGVPQQNRVCLESLLLVFNFSMLEQNV